MPWTGGRAQTLKQAKKAYKNSDPISKLSEKEHRRIDRECVLAERAAQAREKEKRRRQNLKRKIAKEEAERKFRDQAGIGLATQLIGNRHSQKAMKAGMEQFVSAAKSKHIRNAAAVPVVVTPQKNHQDVAPTRPQQNAQGRPMRRVISLNESFGEGLDDELLMEVLEQEHDYRDDAPAVFRCLASKCEETAQSTTESQCTSRIPPDAQVAKALSVLPETARQPVSDGWNDFILSNSQIANEIELGKDSSLALMTVRSPSAESSRVQHDDTIPHPREERHSMRCIVEAEVTKRKHSITDPSHPPAPYPNIPQAKLADPSPPRESAFGQFGLSTQVVYSLIEDDDFDLDKDTGSSVVSRHDDDKNNVINHVAVHDDDLSDCFGSEFDLG